MPLTQQISILGTMPQLVMMVLLVLGGHAVSTDYGFVLGAGTFLVLRLLLHQLPQAHRQGIRLVHQQQFKEAISCFLQSYEFFERHHWLDNYRAIIILSPSNISYREMGLANMAFCYSQIGDGAKARKYYELCLTLFPKSRLALAAIKMMDAVKESETN